MGMLVIDASVVIKWFVPEVHEAEAKRLLTPGNQFIAPDLIFAEIANVMWMKVRRRDLSQADAEPLIRDLHSIPVATVPCRKLAHEACVLAWATGRSAYDAMYLALAVMLNTRLVTADQRLANAIRSRAILAPHIQFIAEIA